jgi:prophage antirepressor-like protein
MSKIKLFKNKQIRTVWNETEQRWYFVLADVIRTLVGTSDPGDYIKKTRKRDRALSKGWTQIISTLWVDTVSAKQIMNCTHAQGLLRIIQAIPSAKAEPFRLWLAQVGAERLDEIGSPELATQRTKELYQLKGYSDEWIESRMKSIAGGEKLTDEKKSGDAKEYSILRSEILKATLGLTLSEYQKAKRAKNKNLRHPMSDLEVIFSMMGGVSTTAIAKTKEVVEKKKTAKQSSAVAGKARKKTSSGKEK